MFKLNHVLVSRELSLAIAKWSLDDIPNLWLWSNHNGKFDLALNLYYTNFEVKIFKWKKKNYNGSPTKTQTWLRRVARSERGEHQTCLVCVRLFGLQYNISLAVLLAGRQYPSVCNLVTWSTESADLPSNRPINSRLQRLATVWAVKGGRVCSVIKVPCIAWMVGTLLS